MGKQAMIIDRRLEGTDSFPGKGYVVAATDNTCGVKMAKPLSPYYTTLEEARKALEALEVRPDAARVMSFTRG